MKYLQVVLAASLVIVLSACGGTKQNPLEDKSEEIQAGIPPGKKPEKEPDPLVENLFNVDGDDYYIFTVGNEKEITISSRTPLEKTKWGIEITNIDQFDGAQVSYEDGDSAKNTFAKAKFKWAAPEEVAIDDITSINLAVKVFSLDNKFSYNKNFSLLVYKDTFSVPTVMSVEKLSGPIREGATELFKVVVKDVDARDKSGERPSLLFFKGSSFEKNGAAYLAVVGDPVEMTGNLWSFKVRIDLRNQEVTKKKVLAIFNVAALSRRGVKSPIKRASYDVITSVLQPVSSWDKSVIEFKIGAKNSYSFTVLDTQLEGKVSASFSSGCTSMVGSSCSCTGSGQSIKTCTVQWDVPLTEIEGTRYDVSYDIENLSPVSGDTLKQVNSLRNSIQLVK